MAYSFYLGKIMLPIAPAALQIKINGNNKTMTLINEGEINLLKQPGLTDISFDALLPNFAYPFSRGTLAANVYLDILESLKASRKPFQFIVSRETPSGGLLQYTNIKVSLEDYTVKEDAEKDGMDVRVQIKLKQYRDYGTKIMTLTGPPGQLREKRETVNAPKPGNTYTVKAGDNLWTIAKRHYGTGTAYQKIYDSNRDKVTNPNLIYPGQVLTMP